MLKKTLHAKASYAKASHDMSNTTRSRWAAALLAATLTAGGFLAGTRAFAAQPAGSQPAAPAEEEAVKALQAEFLKLKFGMFIHFNMATFHGVEWVAGYPDPSTFDPGGPVDTDAWADAAVSAGMKYAVLTAKHVGGFCLWDSQYTTYDVMHPRCPYKQDLVAQFIKSFKSRGLKAGLYYCWRHPGFGDPNKHKCLLYLERRARSESHVRRGSEGFLSQPAGQAPPPFGQRQLVELGQERHALPGYRGERDAPLPGNQHVSR